MAEQTTTYLDFDLVFLNGHREFITAQQGRDLIAADDHRIRIELRPSEDVCEEIIIERSAVAFMRTAKREVQPDPQEVKERLVSGYGVPA